MESISNAASAASKAVFGGDSSGQSGQEPVSGQTGRGTASEPYDAGNTTDDPRLTGLPGDDARPAFSSSHDRDERSTREEGASGGAALGSDNPPASSTGTTAGESIYGRGTDDSSNTGSHSASLANRLDPRTDSDGDGRGSSGPLQHQSATMPGTSSIGSGHTSSTSGQQGATGNHPTTSSDYNPSTSGQSATTATGSGLTFSTSGQPGATGNHPTTGSDYTSSSNGQLATVPDASTMGSGSTSSTGGQSGGTTNLSIDQIAEFITPSGGQVQVIDEGPAAGGIAGRFGPSRGVDLDGHEFPQGEGRSVPATGSGGASIDTTGSSTTAVNTSGSSGVTGSDNTSRDMGSQDNTSGNSGMTGSENTSSDTTDQDGKTGPGIMGTDVAGRSGGTSTRVTGQDDTISGPTGGMQQGGNVQGNRPRPEHNTDKTGVTDMHSDDPKFSDVRQSEAGGSSVDNRGHGISKGPTGGFGAAEPSVSSDPTSGQKPTPKQQGGDRPMEAPTGEKGDAVKGEKEITEKQQAGEDTSSGKKEKKDPNDHSGEPLGTVDHSGGSDDKKHPGQEGGAPHGEDKENKGTGDQWVKTSGMAADGGDFDATKPGAGKEAARLLEQKGIHHEPGIGKPAADPSATDSSNSGGMGSKLKGKLHMG